MFWCLHQERCQGFGLLPRWGLRAFAGLSTPSIRTTESSLLLQYLASSSVIHVDWGRIATRFENMVYTKDPTGRKKAPNVYSLWNWIIDFLTADFQQRASFVAGFALGVRVG